MRHILVAAVLALAAGDASAGRARAVTFEENPPMRSCRQFTGEPRDAISVAFRWDQRLSLAACSQPTAVPAFRGDLDDLPAFVAAIEREFASSIEIYRDAMGMGPSDVRIRGAFALGMTYVAIVVRARSAIDPANERARRALEPLLATPLREANAAFDEVGFLADDFPSAAHATPLVAEAIRSARLAARTSRR